jgi:threonylcarbamoyladenosine tRNA methylthiotransferase MtaB
MTRYYVQQVSSCDRRYLDGQRIANYLKTHGAEETHDLQSADLIIALTCSTTHLNIADSVEMAEAAARQSAPRAKIILAGCLDKGLELAVPDDKLLVRINPKDGLLPLQQALGYDDSPYAVRDCAQTQSFVLNVRVQEGCRGKCAFCDIRQKIGSSRSRSLAEIREDVRFGLNDGVRYVRLVGDDVGTYGVDSGGTLADALRVVAEEAGERELMIDNLDPKYLIEQWDQMLQFVESGKLHHVKLPVQHFNKRLLALMRRATETERIGEIVRELHRFGVLVQSHFIYGFPTETIDDLLGAAAELMTYPFGQVKFIPYSNKERVAAARMPQISLTGMRERGRRLKELLDASGDVVEVEYVDERGLEELVWVREEYLQQRPATAF